MPTTDTSEKGLEALIVESFVGAAGYVQGRSEDYDRDHAVDGAKLVAFLTATQPTTVEALALAEDGPKRTQFLHRLQGEIRLNCPVKERKMLQAYCLKMLVRILPLHSQACYEGSRGVLRMLDGST